MSSARPLQTSKLSAILGAALVAAVLKLLWAWYSVGSYDAAMFYLFAKDLHAHGLASLYAQGPAFNHTPLTATLIRWLVEGSHGNYRVFAFQLRGLCTLADLAVVIACVRLPALSSRIPAWGLYALALNPLSLMVSGFHGNVDPIMVALVFFAAVAALHRRAVWCGLLFGLACQIKIVPILLGPVFLAFWLGRGRRPALAFASTTAVVFLGGIAWALVVCPGPFLSNVFGYGGGWGLWGFTFWLRLTGWHDFQTVNYTDLPAAERWVMSALKFLTIGSIALLAWRRRHRAPEEIFASLAAAFTLIYVFAPGGATQYMVWFVPFLLLDSPRWWVAATLASTVFLAVFYQISAPAGSHFPWGMAFPKTGQWAFWSPWTIPAWSTFAALLVTRWKRWCSFPDAPSAVPMDKLIQHDLPLPATTFVPENAVG